MKLIWAMLATMLLATAAHADELKVLTWNVFMLPTPIKYSRQIERRRVIAAELKKTDFDVIVLQEAFMKKFEHLIEDTMHATHPYVYKLGKSRGFFKLFDSGVMVLSKYPMRLVDKVFFGNCSGFDCFSSKGAVLLELTVQGRDIQLVSTHMQSGQKPKQRSVRTKQLALIKKLLLRNARAGVPQFLAGDLNIDGLKAELRNNEYTSAKENLQMISPTLEGTLRSSKATMTSCFGKKNTTRQARVDHVWLKDETKVFERMNQQVTPIRAKINGKVCDLSDHLPVSLRVGFSP